MIGSLGYPSNSGLAYLEANREEVVSILVVVWPVDVHLTDNSAYPMALPWVGHPPMGRVSHLIGMAICAPSYGYGVAMLIDPFPILWAMESPVQCRGTRYPQHREG